MEQTEKKQVHYKKIENISAYVQKLAKDGASLIIAKKWARIMARRGTPGEKVVSWSVTGDGDLIMEKKPKWDRMPKQEKTTGSQPRSEKTEVFLSMSMEIRMNGSFQILFSGRNTGRIRNIRDIIYRLVSGRHFCDCRSQSCCGNGEKKACGWMPAAISMSQTKIISM